MTDSQDARQLVGIVPSSLCAATRAPWPPTTLREHAAAALRWQRRGAEAEFWGLGGHIQPGGMDRMYEMGGVMAATGERLALSVTAEYELMCWDLQEAAEGPPATEREMARRALAELEGTYALSVGHALANVAGRAIALEPSLRPVLEREVRTAFPPASACRGDWIALSSVSVLMRVASAAGAADLVALVQVPLRLRGERVWQCLEESRGEDFHRWRPQSAGIAGASPGAFGRVRHDGTRAYEFGTDRVIGRSLPAKLADDVRATARAALDLLPATLTELDTALVPVIERLTALRFRETSI